jgi:ABC-type bacteriocin/lantibiotic exporter with double-glycine peptidase domain
VKSAVAYISRVVAFSFARNPALYFALFLSVFSVAIELAAMNALLPLSALATGQTLVMEKSGFARGVKSMGIEPSFAAVAVIFLCLLMLRVITQAISQGMTQLYGRRILAQLASEAFSAIIKHRHIKDIEGNSIGYFISLAGDESFRASTIVTSLIQLSGVAILVFLYFTAIVVFSRSTALAVAAFLCVSAVSLVEAFRKSNRLGIVQIEQSRSAGSIFLDSLNGLRSVRAFLAEGYVTRTYRDRMFAYVRTLFEVDLVSVLSRNIPALLLLGASLVGLAIWKPGNSIDIDVALVVTIALLLLRLFPVVGQAVSILMRVVTDVKAARDVTQILDSPDSGIHARTSRSAIPSRITAIVIEDLSYSHLPDQPILQHFNITLKAGKSYAVKGPSGSGKSTLFDLILGFYKPDGGNIYFNGLPIDQISPESLRGRVLLLGQQPTVFNDNVRNNLMFGASAPEERIQGAVRLAHLDDVISNLPLGLETMLSYQGNNLSGGQRQRLGLARALVREADVLLLDESTSALDTETRDIVVENVLHAYRDRIVVFATHDEYVLSRVDMVIEIAGQKAN